MSHPIILVLIILLALTAGACSKHEDPTLPPRDKDGALQTALDELTRLESFTSIGISYTDYSDRLLTAKANIEVALQKTQDVDAHKRIREALYNYVFARDAWQEEVQGESRPTLSVQHYWEKANTEARLAREYAFADQASRDQMDKEEERLDKEEGLQEAKRLGLTDEYLKEKREKSMQVKLAQEKLRQEELKQEELRQEELRQEELRKEKLRQEAQIGLQDRLKQYRSITNTAEQMEFLNSLTSEQRSAVLLAD